MVLMSWTNAGKRQVTLIAYSKAQTRPNCRCSCLRSSCCRSILRRRKDSGWTCRYGCSSAPTSWLNKTEMIALTAPNDVFVDNQNETAEVGPLGSLLRPGNGAHPQPTSRQSSARCDGPKPV